MPLGALGAVETDGAQSLTWEDCVSLALRNNPDLAASLRAREAGQASYYGSFNGLLPQLSLSNSYGDSGSATPGGPRLSGGGASWGVQGTASMNLFSASQIANIKSASSAFDQASANLRQTSAGLRFNLRSAFLQLLFAQEDVTVSRQIRELRQRGAKLVSLRYESGRESKGNMLRAQAQLLQAESDLAQALRDERTTQRLLDRELGLDDFRALAATGTLSSHDAPESPGDERAILARRPDVAVQEAAVQSAEAGLSQTRSSLWPNVSASYTRSRTGSTELPSAQYGWSVSGLLSYPLFGGGPTATYFNVSAAKRNLEKAREDLRAVRSQGIVDIENAWSDFARTASQNKVQVALLAAARQRNDEADVRYGSGLLTYDNWEIISSDRINQERQALRARLDAVVAEAAWERALGKELGE